MALFQADRLVEFDLHHPLESPVLLPFQNQKGARVLVKAPDDILRGNIFRSGYSFSNRKESHAARALCVEALDLVVQVGDRVFRNSGVD